MITCEECEHELRVVRSVSAGVRGRAIETKCSNCDVRVVYVLLRHSQVAGYGTGAEAVATKLRKGQIGVVHEA